MTIPIDFTNKFPIYRSTGHVSIDVTEHENISGINGFLLTHPFALACVGFVRMYGYPFRKTRAQQMHEKLRISMSPINLVTH